jgi:hypothetical protein
MCVQNSELFTGWFSDKTTAPVHNLGCLCVYPLRNVKTSSSILNQLRKKVQSSDTTPTFNDYKITETKI